MGGGWFEREAELVGFSKGPRPRFDLAWFVRLANDVLNSCGFASFNPDILTRDENRLRLPHLFGTPRPAKLENVVAVSERFSSAWSVPALARTRFRGRWLRASRSVGNQSLRVITVDDRSRNC